MEPKPRFSLHRTLIVIIAILLEAAIALSFQLPDINELLVKADKGDAEAQFEVGKYFLMGKNTSGALKYFRLAAVQGNLEAMTNLGSMYLHGEGVPKDISEGLWWYHRAANGGLPRAYAALGMAYYSGEVMPRDMAEAVKWLRGAAERGYKDVEIFLGEIYLFGKGVSKNYVDASKWLRGPAERGDKTAQGWLGRVYSEKDSPIRNQREAAKWFIRGANQGDPYSQGSLGFMYWSGDGVPRDDIEAYKWLNLAGAQGSTPAQKARDSLASFMTREQVAEAQRRAAAFVPRAETDQAMPENSPRSEKIKAAGSAFFISPDGYLLTNYHVVEDSSRIVIQSEGRTFTAKLIKSDTVNDLAILKISGTFKALPLAPSRGIKLGASIFTIGFPNIQVQGVEPKMTRGDISSVAGMQDDPRFFQISTPVQPGNSGGPLVDQYGNAIGIVTLRLDDLKMLKTTGSLPQNVNYALKSSFILAFLEAVPEAASTLLEPHPSVSRKSEDVVKEAQSATALVLVYY